MTIPIVDAIIGGILLIFIIIGLAKGFIRSVLGLVGTIASLVASYFLAKPFLGFVDGLFGGKIISGANDMVAGWLNGIGPLFSTEIGAQSLNEVFTNALNSIGLPAAISEPIVNAIVSALSSSVEGFADKTPAELLSPVLANIGLTIISIIVLFLLIRMAIYIVEKVLENTILKIGALRALDRLLGMAFGALQGAIIVVLLLTGVTLFISKPDSAVNEAIAASTFGSAIQEANPIPAWISENLDIKAILDDILKKDES